MTLNTLLAGLTNYVLAPGRPADSMRAWLSTCQNIPLAMLQRG